MLFHATQRLMTPEALDFVTQTSIATVKGFEERAPKAEFRRVLIVCCTDTCTRCCCHKQVHEGGECLVARPPITPTGRQASGFRQLRTPLCSWSPCDSS